MHTCVICLGQFDTAPREHILPNAIGWRRFTKDRICSDCNQRTSRFDAALAQAVSLLTTFINPGGRRTAPPAIHTESGTPISLGPGGELRVPDVYEFEDESDGPLLSIRMSSLPELEAKWRRRGKRLEPMGGSDRQEHVLPLVLLDPTPELMVGMAKAALHFASGHVARSQLNTPEVGVIRQTLLAEGSAELPDSAWALDYDLPELSAALFYHGLEVVACPRTGCLAVRVHVFASLRARFVLSDAYDGRAWRTAARVEQTLSNEIEESSRSCDHPVSWLLSRSQSGESGTEAAKSYFAEHAERIKPSGSDYEFHDLARFVPPEPSR